MNQINTNKLLREWRKLFSFTKAEILADLRDNKEPAEQANIVLNGTTMSVVGSGTLAANVTVNDVTDSERTHNAALKLGYWGGETNAIVSTASLL